MKERNKKIIIILLLLFAITASIYGVSRLMKPKDMQNSKIAESKDETQNELNIVNENKTEEIVGEKSGESKTSENEIDVKGAESNKEENKKSNFILKKTSKDLSKKEEDFRKVREIIERLHESKKDNKKTERKDSIVSKDIQKDNSGNGLEENKKYPNETIKENNENKKEETQKEFIKDTKKEENKEIDKETLKDNVEETKKEENKETHKEDLVETEKEQESFDDRFTVLDLNLNSDYQLVYSQESDDVLPETAFIGFKFTGENDNKLHKIVWKSEHFDKIKNRTPGKYSVIVEVLDSLIINGNEYKNVKFNIDIIVKDGSNSYLVENGDNSPVRVILELKSDSIVEEANRQGKDVNELSEEFVSDKRNDLKVEQNKLISELNAKNVKFKNNLTIKYDTLLNGIAGIVQQKDIEVIEKSNLVKKVYYSQEFERPLLKSQQEIIGANHAWSDLKYKGEGTVVAVIDSGIDVKHKDLVIDNDALGKIKYSKEKINKFIEENKLKGKYFSDKVPYGYNYYDFSNNLLYSYGNMHGMHVSGIVGANNKAQGVYGVAPNSQILAMKVFSDDLQYPTTFTDVWLKALDDAIKLGADSINMSLGSPSGFTIDNDQNHPEIKLFAKARKAGIIVTVAVGNEANIVDGNPFNVKSLKENYDTGVVANPAINEDSFAVASMENSVKYVNSLSWNLLKRKYTDNVNLFIPNGVKEDIVAETIDLKEGKEFDSNIEEHHHHSSNEKDTDTAEALDESKLPDVKNKIVLIKWPENDQRKVHFENTLDNIALRNPKAILLARPDDKITGRLVLRGEVGRYVYGIISNKTYSRISGLQLIKNTGLDTRLTINVIQKEVNNPFAGKMSVFSTWGPTPDLRIKPEITAVGGNVSSTVENDNYRNMSGTSMAAPQVSGAVAIMKQYLAENKVEAGNKADLIKLMLMNTANIIKNEANIPYFVRQQGAGGLNLERALKTKGYISVTGNNDNANDGKLELKQISNKAFEFSLKITNISDEKISYKPEIVALKEKIEKGYRTEKPELIKGKLSSQEVIEIPARQTKVLKFVYDFSEDNVEENNFIEGFIKLKSNSDEIDLSLPFLGFYGDWSSQDAIDAFGIAEYNKNPRNAQFFINEKLKSGSSMFISDNKTNLPVINNKVFFSPGSEYAAKIGVRIAPLRNMEEIEYSILDGVTKETLKVIGKSKNVRKLNRLHVNNTFKVMPDSFWDGEINNKPAQANKLFIYQLKVKLNNAGIGSNSEQIYQYPIMIDNATPTIDENKIFKDTINDRLQNIKFVVGDKGTGVRNVTIQTLKFEDEIISDNGFDNLEPPTSSKNANAQFNPDKANVKNSNNVNVVGTKGKPKYGRFVSLQLVDEKPESGKYYTIKDGKVTIPQTDFNFKDEYQVRAIVYRNGWNDDFEVEVPIYADRSHINISVSDYLSNRHNVTIESGFSKNYSYINFVNWKSLADNKMKVYIGDKLFSRENGIYPTINDQEKIRIEFDQSNSHLGELYVRKGKTIDKLILNSHINNNIKKYEIKYNNQNKYIEFKLKDLKSSLEIISTVKKGEMPFVAEKNELLLDFKNIDLFKFKSIEIGGEKREYLSNNSKIKINPGQNQLELRFKDDLISKLKVYRIIVRTLEKDTVLNKGQYFDIISGKIGYSSSAIGININYNFTEDAELIIDLIDKDDNTSNKQDETKKHNSENVEMVVDKNIQPNKSDEEIKENPYPTIFIKSPSLLSMLSHFNVNDDKFIVSGFIGHIHKNDKISSFEAQLVDNYGNPIGKKTIIPKNQFNLKHERFGSLYSGDALPFSFSMPILDRFNINLRIHATMESGKEATVTRRFIYDRVTPTIDYMIDGRDLDSGKVNIRLQSKDDSIALKLYHEDSLIASIDKRSVSFESENGVKLSKELSVNLSYGQNKISISSIDMARNVVTKEIYIYRTKNDNLIVKDTKIIENREKN